MKKLSTSFFMRAAIAIALLFATTGTAAAYNFMYNGLAYNYDGDGTSVYVTYTSTSSDNYGGSLTNVVIPAKITLEGNVSYNVTGIGQNAFSRCSNLQSITIPASVKTIGSDAFYNTNIKKLTVSSVDAWMKTTLDSNIPTPHEMYVGSSLLTSVTIPSTVTTVGSHFSNVTSIKSMTIPSSVTEIGSSAFAGCTGLATLNLGSGVKTIGEFAFSGCAALTSVTFPSSLKNIGYNAFQYCTGLTSLTIPESIEMMDGAFYGCTNIKTLVWNAINLSNNGGIPTANIETVTIGSKVQTLPEYFVSGSKITTVTVPSSVTAVGVAAFQNCTSLKSAVLSSNLTSISNNMFYGCTSLTAISLPAKITSIGSNAFYDCTGLTALTIPENVTTIDSNAFNGCNNISQLTWNAINFTNNHGIPTSNITNVTIGSKVQTIPSSFVSGSKISSLVLPASVTTIGTYAFQNCNNLTALTIPENVTTIGTNAFYGCNNIARLTWNAIDLSTKGGLPATNITKVTIGSSVKTLPASFVKGSKITAVTIPSSVTCINTSAFESCSLLSSVSIFSQGWTYGDGVVGMFRNCTSLKTIDMTQAYIPYINNEMFANCSSLTTVRFSPIVKTIGQSAFGGCLNLSSAPLPASVKTIDERAFHNCPNLITIRIPESVTSIGGRAFGGSIPKKIKFYNASELQYQEYWFEDNNYNNTPLCTIGKGVGYGVTLDPNTSFEVDGITYVITDMTNRKVKIVDIDETKCATDIEVKKVKYHNVEFTPTEIGLAALAGNYTVRNFKVGDVVAYLPQYSFYRCDALRSIDLSANVLSIGQHAFENCTSMSEIVVGDGVNTIDQYVLAGCSALRRVELGANVTQIKTNSFNGCGKIKTLRVRRSTPPNATSGVFNDLDKWSCTLYVPKGTVDTYKNANEWKTFFFISDDETEPSSGDVNGDGKVNVSDVSVLISMILGTTTMDEGAADVNGDGKVNVSDVSALINIILGIN